MPPQTRRVLDETDCPQRLLLDQIADKWSVLAISALNEGPLRFNMMMRRFEGITQKSLTKTLRGLERNGIVARRVIPASPVRVEYHITDLGRSLRKPFAALAAWTHQYLPQVESARQAFDRSAER